MLKVISWTCIPTTKSTGPGTGMLNLLMQSGAGVVLFLGKNAAVNPPRSPDVVIELARSALMPVLADIPALPDTK
jgi:hypothetical protein